MIAVEILAWLILGYFAFLAVMGVFLLLASAVEKGASKTSERLKNRWLWEHLRDDGWRKPQQMPTTWQLIIQEILRDYPTVTMAPTPTR